MIAVRPTIIISVPRLFEKVHAGVLSKVTQSSLLKKMMLYFAVKVSAKPLPFVCCDEKPRGPLLFLLKIADRLVFSKLKGTLGFDRITVCVSGGGPLSVSDAEFFVGMGLRILEGFGLTECSPVTNINRVGGIRIGSVGMSHFDTDVLIR